MSSTAHLVIEQGSEKGRQITVPANGARLGRSSKNDIVVIDPMLSRHHCRLFFKPGEGLCITDLGSANQTLVNNKPVQETLLNVGDFITIGDTILKVLNNAGPSGAKAAITPSSPVIDLGLKASTEPPSSKTIGFKPIMWTAIVAFALVAGAWGLKKFVLDAPQHNGPPAKPAADNTLEIEYEKVEADPENIFRYYFKLTRDNTVEVQITDLKNSRRVPPKRKKVAPALIEDLAQFIRDSGFFGIEEHHKGLQPDLFHYTELSITLGKQTHRVTVENCTPPPIFKEVRDKIEIFGKNEVSAWAIQVSADKLLDMAEQAFLLGKKMRDEREIQYGNLAAAITSFEEADWYLGTVENKPDYYPELLTAITDCKEELTRRYGDQNFRAQRAINLRDWEQAARELRILLEMIPDSSDPRHEEARKKLLEIENRLHLDK